MQFISRFEKHYLTIKSNRWYWLFSIFCRISLSFAFIAAGFVKIIGERFASGLSPMHPMGAYLQALHDTGWYYTCIGIAQVIAALLLLIPRTVVLGAMLYFPIIVNIWLLSYSVRFEGSFVTSPLMVWANLFLLIWHYDKLRYLLPFAKFSNLGIIQKPKQLSNQFPFLFFTFVSVVTLATITWSEMTIMVMPRNSIKDCKAQFKNKPNEAAGYEFCECIHTYGNTLNDCLKSLENQTSK